MVQNNPNVAYEKLHEKMPPVEIQLEVSNNRHCQKIVRGMQKNMRSEKNMEEKFKYGCCGVELSEFKIEKD